MIRIRFKDNRYRVNTFFYNKKWITFLHTLGQDAEQLTADSLLLAGQNHLTFLQRIKNEKNKIRSEQKADQIAQSKSQEQSQKISSSIKTEEVSRTEASSSIQSNQETQIFDSQESVTAENQEGTGSAFSSEGSSNQTEAI